MHVHLLPDVRLLVHQDQSGLLPRAWPLQVGVIGARGQVEVHGHVPGAAAYSVQVNTYLNKADVEEVLSAW